jgi:hypothetical protein
MVENLFRRRYTSSMLSVRELPSALELVIVVFVRLSTLASLERSESDACGLLIRVLWPVWTESVPRGVL